MTTEQINFIVASKDSLTIRNTIDSFTSTSGFLIRPRLYTTVQLDDANELLVCTIEADSEQVKGTDINPHTYYHSYADIIAVTKINKERKPRPGYFQLAKNKNKDDDKVNP